LPQPYRASPAPGAVGRYRQEQVECADQGNVSAHLHGRLEVSRDAERLPKPGLHRLADVRLSANVGFRLGSEISFGSELAAPARFVSGRSSVPARNRTVSPGAAWYLLHSAVPHLAQRKTSCGLPLPAVSMSERSFGWSVSTKRRSIQILRTNALPVCRWQSRQ